jgi:serine/threonine protein kinase
MSVSGQMIAGLEILNLHAQGGMAEVYRARGKGADGRTWHYAVKRILPELTQNAELRKMFVEEARVASLLLHPNIVRVYDLAKGENDDYYIVMEFLEGRDLAEVIDRAVEGGRTIPVWMCIHLARQVLAALVYATTEARDREGNPLALIHRDISPHNVFGCFDGQVKLTDFGVAKVAQSSVHTQVGVTKGKFGYMSPEQLLSEKLDFRSDLYNVGILLYETLTCRRLFSGDSPSQFLQSMLRGTVPALEPALGVPRELERLMRRVLSKDREERPASPQALDDELAAIAERFGLLATREHVAAELRAVFGSEIESCPVPQSQEGPPRRLASISAALPEVVRRAEVPAARPLERGVERSSQAPSRPRSRPGSKPAADPEGRLERRPGSRAGGEAVSRSAKIFPPQQARPRSLSDPSVEVATVVADDPRTIDRVLAEGARQTRPRAVRELPAGPDGEEPVFRPERRTDPGRPMRGRLASSDSSSDSDVPEPYPATLPPDHPLLTGIDPSTLPPDRAKSGEASRPTRRPTVIVGGGGAKPLPAPKQEAEEWGEATELAMGDELTPRGSVVTRSPRVVPLSSAPERKK